MGIGVSREQSNSQRVGPRSRPTEWRDRSSCQPTTEVGFAMSNNTDDVKGRLKEAAGDLTDDKDLKREGKIDRAEGAAKDKLDDAADKVKDAVTSDA